MITILQFFRLGSGFIMIACFILSYLHLYYRLHSDLPSNGQFFEKNLLMNLNYLQNQDVISHLNFKTRLIYIDIDFVVI